MANPRGKRSPEEIAKSMAIARAVMENQKKKEGIDAAKSGAGYIIVASVYFVLMGVIDLYFGYDYDAYFFFCLTGLYVLLAITYLKNPFVISVVAFAIFVLVIIMHAIADPRTLFGGLLFFIVKLTAITGLIAAMKAGYKYKNELAQQSKKEKTTDILDDELLS